MNLLRAGWLKTTRGYDGRLPGERGVEGCSAVDFYLGIRLGIRIGF